MQAKQHLLLMIISLIFAFPSMLLAETLTLAVASNFKPTAIKLKTAFEQQHPHKIRIVSASSGKLYAQILQQAPFDIFLSADQQKPALLVQHGLVSQQHIFTYAIGELLLWSADTNLNVKNCLLQHCYTRLAMANSQYAPYGVAAEETLQALDLLPLATQKIIIGENINQTLQFIQSRNVELGFIAASQLQLIRPAPASNAQNLWKIPSSLYSAIKQDAAWLKHSTDNIAAKTFWQFLQQAKAQGIIKNAAYQIVESSKP